MLGILTVLGIHWIASHRLGDFYSVGVKVIAVEDDSFLLRALPDQSNLEIDVQSDPYRFEIDPFFRSLGLGFQALAIVFEFPVALIWNSYSDFTGKQEMEIGKPPGRNPDV